MILRTVALLVFATSGFPAVINAAIIDQQNSAPLNVQFGGSHTWQQEVTTGLTGQLAGVDIWFTNVGTAHFSINRGAAWQSDANDYFADVLVTAQGWTHIDVSAANLQFVAGDKFVIGLSASTSTNFDFLGTGAIDQGSVDQYSGGAIHADGSSNPYFPSFDMGFRTYVETASVVPEPAALTMLGLSVLGFAGAAMRRRKRAAYVRL